MDLQNYLSMSRAWEVNVQFFWPFYTTDSFADRQFYEDWVCFFFIVKNCGWLYLISAQISSTYGPCWWLTSHIHNHRWNSTSWDEFSRKWNKPVHTFLLRHIYASSISGWHVSRSTAMFITFVMSALAHELVMAVVTKKIRWVTSIQLGHETFHFLFQ